MSRIVLPCFMLAAFFLLSIPDGWSAPASRPNSRKPHKIKRVWKQTRAFWKPRLKRTWRETRDFWVPRFRRVGKETLQYWQPKGRRLMKETRSFWLPNIRWVTRANREYWLPRIERQFLPYVRKQYRFLGLHYGHRWSRAYAKAMRTLKPAWAFPRYLLRGGTSSAKKQARVPATVKMAFDRYFSWSLTHIHKRLARSRSLPPTLQNTMKQLARAMVPSRDRRFQQRLERLLARLRPYVADAGMRSCYRVVALESRVVNAFNTGCTNYITRGLAAKLTNLQLMAVLAHEIAHGDQGHAVRNIGLIATSVGEHSFRLISEEIAWFLTGKWGPLLQKVLSKGHLTPILQAYGVRAPQIEIEADVGATKMLLRGGYSPAALVRALQILHMGQRKPATRRPTSRPSGGVRQYPGLARRIQAIRKAWK